MENKNTPELIEAAKSIARELYPTYNPSQHGDQSPEDYVEYALEGFDLPHAIVMIAVEGYKRGDECTWEHIIATILLHERKQAIHGFVEGVKNV